MLIYFFSLLLLIAGCSEVKIQSRKTILAAYNFKQHPNWQSNIIIANKDQQYNLIFCDSSRKSQTEINNCAKNPTIIGAITDQKLKSIIKQINPSQIRKQMLRHKIETKTAIINHKNHNIKYLCRHKRSWLLDLDAGSTIHFLKHMPRSCPVLIIWSTADLSKFKVNAYLDPILKQVKHIDINEIDVMQKCFQDFTSI